MTVGHFVVLAQAGDAAAGGGNGNLVDTAMEWIVTSGTQFLVSLVAAVFIIIVGKFVIAAICGTARAALERADRVSELMENFMINVLSKVLWAVVLMIAIQQLGVPVGPLVAGLGVTGFIVGFAFQETLGNLASGMMIALNQPFTVGDLVEIGGNLGSVSEMNMMATTLHTPDNKKVVVPNKNVWGSAITNYTALDSRRVDLGVGIAYGADIGKAKSVIMETVKNHELVLDDPAPTVEVLEMGDSSVNLVVRPWCKTADYWGVFFAVNQAVKEALDGNEIEIPFPQMDVHFDAPPQA